jgi:hypothetical protein
VNGKTIGDPKGITSNYPYADHYAPHGHFEYNPNPTALYDFFQYGFRKNWTNPRTFSPISQQTNLYGPMVCFVKVQSVDRIIYSIFQRFNLEWKTRTLKLFTQAA